MIGHKEESLEAKIARIDERTKHMEAREIKMEKSISLLLEYKWKATGVAIGLGAVTGAVCSMAFKIIDLMSKQ